MCLSTLRGPQIEFPFNEIFGNNKQTYTNLANLRGPHSPLTKRLRFSPSGPRFDSWHSRNFLMLLRFIDSPLLREWTVQSLIVDRTHLVLVSGTTKNLTYLIDEYLGNTDCQKRLLINFYESIVDGLTIKKFHNIKAHQSKSKQSKTNQTPFFLFSGRFMV